MAVTLRRYAGPKRALARYTWKGDALTRRITDETASAMHQLARDIEIWLHANLHIWTGEMNRAAFAEVYAQNDQIIVRFGSDTDHTFWHEVVYHPQLRECADTFGPRVGRLIQQAVRGAR